MRIIKKDDSNQLKNNQKMIFLHDDLELYLFNEPQVGGKTLKHPLLYAVPYFEDLNQMYNDLYEHKVKLIEQYKSEKKYDSIFWLYERAHRLIIFFHYQDLLSDQEYWSILGKLWIDSKVIWENKDFWNILLNSSRESKELFMERDEVKDFKELPKTLTIYRGYVPKEKNKNGISYTLQFDHAKWYAERLGKKGRVLTLQVHKSDIFAIINRRHEAEIILKPSVMIKKSKTVLAEKETNLIETQGEESKQD